MMIRRLAPPAAVLALALASATAARTQDRDDAPGAVDVVPLRVEVTVSRYRGDELTSSLPYSLAVTTGGLPSSLGMHARMTVRGEGSFSYEQAGTDISCAARVVGEGRYRIRVLIEESSIEGAERASTVASLEPGTPIFPSFTSDVTLVLRDGESRQYLAATDRVTGETIRIDMALTVLD